MKLFDNTGTTMVEVYQLGRKGENLVMKTNLMESMPTDIYVRPSEVWKLLGLVLKWEIISYIPALLCKAWRQRKSDSFAAAPAKAGAKPGDAPKPAAPAYLIPLSHHFAPNPRQNALVSVIRPFESRYCLGFTA